MQPFCWFNCFSLGTVRNQTRFLKEMRNLALTTGKDDKGTQKTLVPLWNVPLQNFLMNADIVRLYFLWENITYLALLRPQECFHYITLIKVCGPNFGESWSEHPLVRAPRPREVETLKCGEKGPHWPLESTSPCCWVMSFYSGSLRSPLLSKRNIFF